MKCLRVYCLLTFITLCVNAVCGDDDKDDEKDDEVKLTYRHVAALWNNITTGRNKQLRPVLNPRKPLNIYLYFHLTYIQEFDEMLGKLSVLGYFGFHWTDETVSWKEEDYHGIPYITFNEEILWKPTISMANPFGPSLILYKDDTVKRVHSDGRVDWYPGGSFDVTCEADVTAYPFDTQRCSISVIINSYYGSEIQLVPLGFPTTWLVPHRTWDLIDSTVTKIDDPQVVYFRVTLKRRPMFFVFNLILPIVLMCLLNPFVFLLPAESGERVGYSVTVLLAIAVFLTISSSSLPAISEPIIPPLCILLFVDVSFSALIVLFVIMTLRFYLRSEEIPVSNHASRFVRFCRYLRCGCCSRTKNSNRATIETKKMDETELSYASTDYLYRGTNSAELDSYLSKDSKGTDITWKDVGSELDIFFGIMSGVIMFVIHLLYILSVGGFIF